MLAGRGVGGPDVGVLAMRVGTDVAGANVRVGTTVGASVGVGTGVGVGGAVSVTTSGADSCGLPKLSTTRSRNRYRPGDKPVVSQTPSSARSTAWVR